MNAHDDRELLELAAKAAGLFDDGYRAVFRDGEGWVCIRPADDKCQFQSVWAPLTDDGDALRLAVKLQLQVTPGTYNKEEFTAFHAGRGEAHEYLHYKQDEYAATRRAIVRAAAAIGRAMP